MEKLEKLTPEQEAMLPVKRDEWIAIGLNTERADRKMAEEGVRKAYATAGLTAPTRMIWVDNPLSGAYLQALVEEVEVEGDHVTSAQIEEMMSGLSKSQTSKVRERLQKWSLNCCWGQHEVWLSFYDTFAEFGIDTGQITGLVEVAKSCGWWWPMEDVVVLTERPALIHLDDQQRLHAEDGPAIQWPDGWGFYCWHGTRVPEWDINSPSVGKAMSEQNTEIRRAAFEKIGWGEVMKEVNEEPIDVCEDPGNPPHSLALYRLPDKINPYGRPVNLLLMVNGSPDRSGEIRRYGETVPADIDSALAAAAWQYGVDADVYRQLARRT